MNFERYINDRSRESGPYELNEKFWGDIISNIDKNIARKLTPQRLRAEFITSLFNIPQGWASALSYRETGEEARIQTRGSHLEEGGNSLPKKSIEYLYPELDRLLRKYFLHRTSVEHFSPRAPIPFEDFTLHKNSRRAIQDFTREVSHLKNKQERVLAKKLAFIFEKENLLTEKAPELSNPVEENVEVHFHYLPGGNPLFLRGYIHDGYIWEETYRKKLSDIYRYADYISIEGYQEFSLGESIPKHWEAEKSKPYAELMRSLVRHGFNGYFIETDGRNKKYFNPFLSTNSILLSDKFYSDYFGYLKRENRDFLEGINSLREFKELFFRAEEEKKERAQVNGKALFFRRKRGKPLFRSSLFRGASFGTYAFSDALSAIKFFTLSELMNRGEIEKGIMVDFQGASHTIQKSFFLKYPMHAMEVVLRLLPLVFAQTGSYFSASRWNGLRLDREFRENEERASTLLRNPNWVQFISELGRIPVFKTEKRKLKRLTKPGPFQMKMKKVGEYNLFTSLVRENENLPQLIGKVFDDAYLQRVIDRYSS